MSEYWKSTPKYWCKHCKTYVRDTKLEKTNHEATPKHQGNLKRFLRDLHRGHEQEERDKSRAKAEVARLNGMVTGSGIVGSSSNPVLGSISAYSAPKPRATAADRRKQLAQLAEMGVSIPDEFRPDMAMAGDWEVTEERIIPEPGSETTDSVAMGVRKREREEDDEEAAEARKKRWGHAHRAYPSEVDPGDLNALLSSVPFVNKDAARSIDFEAKQENKKEIKGEDEEEIKVDMKGHIPAGTTSNCSPSIVGGADDRKVLEIKKEKSDEGASVLTLNALKDEQPGAAVVFKKRKAKDIRRK